VPQPLPLFPLGSVLFPGLVLPLHVFEERYRLLVRELLELPEDARRFGVVAIRQGREVGGDGVLALHDVGCVAELRQVQAYDDGRFDVVTVGAGRFTLSAVDDTRPYLTGAVELLDEPLGDPGELPGVDTAVRVAFAGYLSALAGARGGTSAAPDLPDDPLVLSYLVAAATALDLDVRQGLLAEPDAVARLRRELSLLRHETALLQRLPSAPAPDLLRGPVNPN
jgi:Lon protease-like protein